MCRNAVSDVLHRIYLFFFFLVFWFYYQSLNSTFHKQYRALLIIITININRRLFEINAKRDKSLNINFYEYVNIKYSRFFFIVMYLGCFYVISSQYLWVKNPHPVTNTRHFYLNIFKPVNVNLFRIPL